MHNNHPTLTVPALDPSAMTDYDLAQLSGACIVDIGGSASPYHVVGKVSTAVLCGRIRSKLEEGFCNLTSIQGEYARTSIGAGPSWAFLEFSSTRLLAFQSLMLQSYSAAILTHRTTNVRYSTHPYECTGHHDSPSY